ncbi:hypothetical protein JCM11491_000065 [Sporobolomyces phaffii]
MTTTTLNWILVKYSRSCTTPARAPGHHPESGAIEPTLRPKPEFDHFVQPEISLRLETIRSRLARDYDVPITHSILLTVWYDPHSSDPKRRGQHAVTLDRFDLLDFSSPTIRSQCPPDELPLKGVYRDDTLGLRYVHVDRGGARGGTAGGGGDFRRVQFKFESTRERERFMAAVHGIIPIKLAAVPATNRGPRGGSDSRSGPAESSNRGYRGSTPGSPSTVAPPPRRPDHSESALRIDGFGPSPTLPEPYRASDPPVPAAARARGAVLAPLPARTTRRLAELFPDSTLRNRRSDDDDPAAEATDATPCERLAAMDARAFANLVDDVLFDDGFDDVLRRVERFIDPDGAQTH